MTHWRYEADHVPPPKGIVAGPGRWQRLAGCSDSRGVLVALAGLLLGYCLRRWWQVGRDPRAG